MKTNEGTFGCAATCWLIAALGGAAVFALLMLLADFTFVQAFFFGGIGFIAGGLFLSWAFCSALPAPGVTQIAPRKPMTAVPAAPHAPAAAPTVTPTAAPVAAAAPSPAATWAPAPTPAPTPAPAPMQTAAPAVAPAAPVMAPVAEAAPVARAVAADGRPPMLSAARGGKPDDLKIVRGIGPKLEKLLHSMGIFHFDQIADWQAAELAWVDDHLEGFKGRASRDQWVVQAKVLARGGTEAEAFAAADAAMK